ncbi:ABC transporter permease [Flexivirga caeni]|uniref:ABC transporter permease n=1 Tax=Flexivirga caeni TaxID=2294115 RepID=UPI0013153770|nr:ABC transporter permease [Flexivirga caeni]
MASSPDPFRAESGGATAGTASNPLTTLSRESSYAIRIERPGIPPDPSVAGKRSRFLEFLAAKRLVLREIGDGDQVGLLEIVWAQVIRRGSRSLALFLGLLVACAGFTVLTAQSRSQELVTRGKVTTAGRSAYDILVRPQGVQLPMEKKGGLVQAGFLSGIHGGISLAQWHQIEKIQGVEVAAPVAVIGYVVPRVAVPAAKHVNLNPGNGSKLFRLDTTWHTDNGASTEDGRPSFLYVTSGNLTTNATQSIAYQTIDGVRRKILAVPTTNQVTVHSPPTQVSALTKTQYESIVAGDGPQSGSALGAVVGFPFLLEAVDPAAEAKLAGLKGAMVSGKYLGSGNISTAVVGGQSSQQVPVVVASSPATHISLSYKIQELSSSAVRHVQLGKGFDSLLNSPGVTVGSGSFNQDAAYQELLRAMKNPGSALGDTGFAARDLSDMYVAGPTSYTGKSLSGAKVLAAQPQRTNLGVWQEPPAGGGSFTIGSIVPAGADDTAFRNLTGYQWDTTNTSRLGSPTVAYQGTFDASRLPGYSALTRVPLGTYASTVVTGATAKDRKILGDKALPPSPNIAGYVQPAPLMITSLSSLPAFESGSAFWNPVTTDKPGTAASPVNAAAPISSIRIRVNGVTGVGAASRARVRLVAQQIEAKTHLLVDVTIGSSPAPQTIVLPAGEHGRPQLTLHENWVKKGVTVAILTAVDKKSVALFLLVLVVCALFVANTVAASVRARRTELGVLACLGWRKSRLVALVGIEIAGVALAAGIGGGLIAWAAGSAFGLPVSPGRAALAIPAALIVALVAGVIPAVSAAQASPMEAVQPQVSVPRRASSPHTVIGLGWVNATRRPGRSVLAAAGLAIAVAALGVIAGILTVFRGNVVGTLLGNTVSVEVRGSDKAAVIAILILAGIGVANVLFLEIRERGTELATLQAIGWRESDLTALLLTEGVLIGVAGSVVGAGLALVILAVVIGSLSTGLVWSVLVAALIGIVISVAATIPPVATIRRLPTATLLTEE